MLRRRVATTDMYGSPRYTQIEGVDDKGRRQLSGLSIKGTMDVENGSSNELWRSVASRRRVDSFLEFNTTSTRPPCSTHTIQHCYCKLPTSFLGVSDEDWRKYVRPVQASNGLQRRRLFGEPYDSFRQIHSKPAPDDVFEAYGDASVFEIRGPPPHLPFNTTVKLSEPTEWGRRQDKLSHGYNASFGVQDRGRGDGNLGKENDEQEKDEYPYPLHQDYNNDWSRDQYGLNKDEDDSLLAPSGFSDRDREQGERNKCKHTSDSDLGDPYDWGKQQNVDNDLREAVVGRGRDWGNEQSIISELSWTQSSDRTASGGARDRQHRGTHCRKYMMSTSATRRSGESGGQDVNPYRLASEQGHLRPEDGGNPPYHSEYIASGSLHFTTAHDPHVRAGTGLFHNGNRNENRTGTGNVPELLSRIEWLEDRLAVEKQTSAALARRLRTAEEECIDPGPVHGVDH